MTFELDSIDEGPSEPTIESEPTRMTTGRMISLHFITTALRRRRRLWLGLALLGLVLGTAYHVVVPPRYAAKATVYLAHPPNTDPAVGSANDVAMLQTGAVAQRAIALLGEPGLTSSELLGKAPATAVSDNVLTLTVSGPSAKEAVRRVNALTTAYLEFRTQRYDAQNQSVVKAINQQITKLQSQLNVLTGQINALVPGSQGQELTTLIGQQTTMSAQVTTLQQSVQQDNLDTLSVSKGSTVLTAGTAAHLSLARLLALDGLTGLVAGLAAGLFIVTVQAVLSDRLRRREDIAAVLGVPVDVSIGPLRRRFRSRPTVAAMAAAPPATMQPLVQYLYDRLEAGGPRPTELLVALDDLDVPAGAMAALAARLSSSGKQVGLVDATDRRVLGRALGLTEAGTRKARIGSAPEVTLVVLPRPWEPDLGERGDFAQGDLADLDAVLVVATCDLAHGAWHLQRWGTDAVLAVSAGASTAQRINAVAELLDAAQVPVSSAVLLETDADDDSVGLPEPGAAGFGRRLGVVPTARAVVT